MTHTFLLKSIHYNPKAREGQIDLFCSKFKGRRAAKTAIVFYNIP
jgi:hypothetical protein